MNPPQKQFCLRSSSWIILVIIVGVVALAPDVAWAAPGGKIVSGLFKTTFGKILLAALTILFAPLIAWIVIKERIAEKKVRAHLKRLAEVDRSFDWMNLKDRITDCYHRVHAAWRTEDMSEASEWMTSWYWQNQQLAFLNQWERDGLINHCLVKSISGIRPLFLKFENGDQGFGEGSRLVVLITANMEDYLAERASGKIVEGKKGFADTQHVWTFILQKGKWVVSCIEEASMSFGYVKMPAEVPETLPAKGAVVS